MSFIISRRRLIAGGAASAAAVGFGGIANAKGLSHGMFTHGVASGDPLQTAVIVWTRCVTADARRGRIAWEVAEDEAFERIVKSGVADVSPARDFCVKVDVTGLAPGRPYAYRFVSAEGPGVTGLTRTAPEKGAGSMSFAQLSCANLPFGYFHAYRDAAARPEIELCVHLGDYIYEYRRGKYPTVEQAVPERMIVPETEIVSLSDYHRRYARYRDDPDLQELHRVKPWVTVWDDHELANDTWRDGAQNHDADTQGSWAERRARAVAAYLDWMPVRQTQKDRLAIYRRFDWGGLATILALDTRLIGRSRQLSYSVLTKMLGKDDAAVSAAIAAFRDGPLADPSRSMLGRTQEAWLDAELKRSKGAGVPWQVVAQQVLVGIVNPPPEMSRFLPDGATDAQKAMMALRSRMVMEGLPFALDMWGGYPVARERFLASLQANANNALVLAGDSHNAWANHLPGTGGRLAGVEIGCTAVASPGVEVLLGNAEPGEREAALTGFNDGLTWCDATNKGYTLVTVTPEAAAANFIATGAMQSPGASLVSETRLISAASASGAQSWARA